MDDHSATTESVLDVYTSRQPLMPQHPQSYPLFAPPHVQMYNYETNSQISYRVDVDIHNTDDLDAKRRQAAELLARIESEFTEFKDRLYQEKMCTVRKEIEDLLDDKHTELSEQLYQLSKKRQEKLSHAEQWREYQLECLNKRYQAEREQAENEFVHDKQSIRDRLLERLYETQRKLEEERYSSDISLESALNPVREALTRKLRRRGLENANMSVLQAKKKMINGPQLQLLLDDVEIQDDLYAIQRGLVPKIMAPITKQQQNIDAHDVYFENGYLMYDRQRFMRLEDIIIDTKHGDSYVAQITAINTGEVWVKKRDGSKAKLYVNQLRVGKYTIRALSR